MRIIEGKTLPLMFDPARECAIFKRTFSSKDCEEACDYVERFIGNPSATDRTRPNYWANSMTDGSHLISITFRDLTPTPLVPFFEALFDLYRKQLLVRVSMTEFWTQFPEGLTPTIFVYHAGAGRLERHRHQNNRQQSQFLLNLTRSGIDYTGGETEVEIADGSREIFDASFTQGDIFSFPYHLFHRVNQVGAGSASGRQKRISLLMPILNHSRGQNIYPDRNVSSES